MDYKKLAEAPVFRGLSERFLENFIGRTPNVLLYRGRFVSRCICCIVAGYGLIW